MTNPASRRDGMAVSTNMVSSRTLPPGVIRIFGDLTFRTDGAILDLAVSPDGTIWTIESPGTLRRWSREGKQIGSPVVLSEVEVLWAFSADGCCLVAGSDELAVYATDTGQLRFVRRQPVWVTALALDPWHRKLAAGHDDGQITVWEADSPVPVESWPAHDSPVNVLAFSPDGTTLASGGEDRKIRLWDSTTGELRKVLDGHTDRIHALAWHPGARILAAAGWDTMARIWDTFTGEPIILLNGHAEVVSAAVFSPDGRWLVTADSDHLIWVWDHAAGKPIHRLRGHAGEISSLVFAPDGKLLSGGEDRRVLRWDVQSGQSLTGVAEPVSDAARLAIRPDGQQLAFVNGSRCLWIWNPHYGSAVRRHDGGTDLTAIAYSPNGDLLAIGDESGCIHVFQAEDGKPIRSFPAHKTAVTDLAFRPDRTVLASSGATDGYVYLWNMSDWEPRLLIPEAIGKGTVERIAWLPNSPWLLACGVVWINEGPKDGRICAWDVEKPGKAFSLHGGAIRLATRSDGKQAATSDGSSIVAVWDLRSAQLITELETDGDATTAVAYSPDGKFLAAACRDGSVCIWDAQSLAVVKRLELDMSLADLVFAPQGRLLYAANPGVLCYAIQF